MEAILSRRSIRKYTDKEVSKELEVNLLKAAMAAPSAHNRQPWHFIIIRDRDILKKITEFHRHSQMLKEASLAIIVCGDNEVQKTDFWIHDCSAATENILIAAQAFGLGAVWLGVHPSDDYIKGVKELLQIPDHVTPLGIISIGYPAEEKPPGNRFDPSKVHENKW